MKIVEKKDSVSKRNNKYKQIAIHPNQTPTKVIKCRKNECICVKKVKPTKIVKIRCMFFISLNT